MQSSRAPVRRFADSKPKLLGLISVIVIGILVVPVILPHIHHVNMIYHILLHLASFIISIFLGTVSFIAYKRNHSGRLLFMALGFLSLIIIECLYLAFATTNIEDIIIPVVRIELPHVILFVMLTLFGLGVFRVSNKNL
ncbi:MAG TPA: hypothetical protein VH415_11350 [Nitrososphaeraceae archaeon]